MSSLLERADQAISVTQVARSAKEILRRLSSGKQERLLVLKNNTPAAVLLSVPAFEALMDELEDLRIEAVARRRLRDLKPTKTLSHAQMMRRYARPGDR